MRYFFDWAFVVTVGKKKGTVLIYGSWEAQGCNQDRHCFVRPPGVALMMMEREVAKGDDDGDDDDDDEYSSTIFGNT